MTVETRQLVRKALDNLRDDNLERARAAFRYCSPEQMQQEFGQSGKTRAQILAGYEAHQEAINAALKELGL